MQNKTWTFIDKTSWPRGPWDAEPDKEQWTDAATGLPCLAVRNCRSGHWCGYVGIVEGHPHFEASYSDVPAEVHGELTFADSCAPEDKERGICHVVEAGENDRVWWLGFHCRRAWDMAPTDHGEQFDPPAQAVYRTLEFVKAECANLAAQLAAEQEARRPRPGEPAAERSVDMAS